MILGKFIHSTLLTLPAIAIVLLLAVSISNAQTASSATSQDQVATVVNSSTKAPANVPVYSDYRGVTIGMTADEVRSKLDGIKKGNGQDVLVFSEHESAQIYYDDKNKVTAISIDYIDTSKAPSPETVLGVGLQPKADGSMYQLTRYPEAGYWVSYNRTAGDKPIVTITIQKM